VLTNPYAWAALAAIAVAVLYNKGYFGLPKQRARPASSTSAVPALDGIDALTLGVAFARAKRIEALNGMDAKFANDAGDALAVRYTAPFSQPAQPEAVAVPGSPAKP
jgi:hypothetical protein